MRKSIGMLAATAAIMAFAATAALAHHGWTWAEEEQSELTGIVRTVTIAPPHPSLQVETASDGLWKIELGNPRQTQRAGFVEGSAKPGDEVVILGNRSLDQNEKRMKAVRITVNGKVFDIYPERIRTN
ncbi:hypothetical protein SAMN05892877_101297 [Rhizobium subbaraonis]|uniref:DUF5666 domain-containing protein n=1 Tax=Rhizobium subbaraonis TaxID=908946 RepID=A0A285U4X2_9HYPH|nr:DUF6152 family protein [Rhizobium subbaraonis]SOC35321.1 hypothetical protein SAMN05892877_101297 [Rhizobium subbaraonis]